MPREQVNWSGQQSLHDNDNIHTHKCCTYYSIVNADTTKYPYSSSFEREQSWTLKCTMSTQNKRYQSSIENIYLTVPSVLAVITPFSNDKSSNANYNFDENNKIKLDQSVAFLPPLPPTRQHALSSHRFNRPNVHQQQKQKTLTNHTYNSKTNSIKKNSRSVTNTMRIMRVNGEFVVRI